MSSSAFDIQGETIAQTQRQDVTTGGLVMNFGDFLSRRDARLSRNEPHIGGLSIQTIALVGLVGVGALMLFKKGR